MKKIYIIGIGGAGTSALANIYRAQGFAVSGVDDGDGFYARELQKKGIIVHRSFDQKHISKDIDLVVHTTAIQKDNIELKKAKEEKIKILRYPEAIGELTNKYKTIAICGTHGKTTTTALTAYALIASKEDPTVIVGSHIYAWEGGAHAGNGAYFIIEADEYQNKLAFYQPFGAILTSVDLDHPDFFANIADYKKVFADFLLRLPKEGYLVACGDDDNVRAVAQNANTQVFFYGENKLNNCRITKREVNAKGQVVTVVFREKKYEIKTQLFGLHNAKNAIAAWLMNVILTNDAESGARGISQFIGTARRFERKGSLNDAVLIDDYAHHPREIVATLLTAHEVFVNKKIIVAFHPHTFSRTEAFLDEFAQALNLADHVIVLDIYASARESKGNVTAHDLVDAIDILSQHKAQHIATVEKLAQWMQRNLSQDDIFLTLGAGDIWKVYDLIR